MGRAHLQPGQLAHLMHGLVVGVAGVVAGALLTAVLRGFALRFQLTAAPNPIIPQHTQATPYLGGLAVAITLATLGAAVYLGDRSSFLAILRNDPVLEWIWVPALLFLVLGLVDDVKPFSPFAKLIGQAFIALVAVSLGFQCAISGHPVVDAALAFFWILTLVNAYNVTDVCDGLLSGLALLLFLFLALLEPERSLLHLGIAAAIAGFLVLNVPPAKIFLGDGGSHLLGFLAASLTIRHVAETGPWPHVPMVVMATAVPLFELIFLVVVRQKKGLAFWEGSPDHFSLRLQEAGFSRLGADGVGWGLATMLCAAAGLLLLAPPWAQGVIAVTSAALLLAFGALILRWEA